MPKPRMTTAQRQAALFGALPKPAPALVIPPPSTLPTNVPQTDNQAPNFEDFLKLPESNAPQAPLPQNGQGGSSPRPARYYGFRTRHTPNAPWTKHPGRWKRIASAAQFAKAAKDADPRIEIQLFAVP